MLVFKKLLSGNKKKMEKPEVATGYQRPAGKPNQKCNSTKSDIGKTVTISVHNAINLNYSDKEARYSDVTFSFGNAQHIGKRSSQQDSFGYSNLVLEEIIRQNGILAVLADGMGGLSNGKQISDYTVSAMLSMFAETDGNSFHSQELMKMAESLNFRVNKAFPPEGNIRVGSTLIAAHIFGDSLNWLCIGDSRVYLFRNRMLYQLNEDHNYLSDLLKSHISSGFPLNMAKNDPQKGALTSYIGSDSIQRTDRSIKPFQIIPGDKIILCSDGIYNAISHYELISNIEFEPQIAAERILDSVLDKKIPDQDNATIMIIEYDYV